jgi:hypothetical protein
MGGTCCAIREKEQIGRSILWLQWWQVDRFTAAVKSAEGKLKRPVSCIEIFVELKHLYEHSPLHTVTSPYETAAILFSLLREDRIFADNDCHLFTTERKEGFKSYSEIFKAMYPGYKLDTKQRVVSDSAETISFQTLWTILKSKDQKLMDEAAKMFEGDSRFLNGDKFNQKIALTTFPRSGNSHLRQLIEKCTGVTTGATVHLGTSTPLQCIGLKGEEIVDDRVWVVKAHHPAVMPGVLQFECNKVICLVRNPLDVIYSFACLTQTMSSTKKPAFKLEEQTEWWDWWVRSQADNYKQYFDTLIRHCTEQNKALIQFVRYEDIVDNPKQQMNDIMKFMLNLDDLAGTNAERRIASVCDSKPS